MAERENLLNAYNQYEARQKEAENQKLKKENNILKQNAAAAAKHRQRASQVARRRTRSRKIPS